MEKLKLLQKAFDSAITGIVITESQGNDNPIIYCNTAFEKMSGYAKPEIIGNDCRFLQGNDRDQKNRELLRESLKKSQQCQVVLKNYKKTGEMFWNELTISPVFENENENENENSPKYFIGVQKNITKQKEIELKLQESEEKFRQVTENINEVFWLGDWPSENLIYVSRAYEKIWGRKVQDIYKNAEDWLDAIHSEDRERVEKSFLEKSAIGGFDEVYRILRPDHKERWIRDRGFPIKNEQGKVYRIAGIASDITYQKKLEQDIIKISNLEQQRIGQDLHDGIGQQLTAIALSLEVLETNLKNESHPKAKMATKIAETCAKTNMQMNQIVKGLALVSDNDSYFEDALRDLQNLTVELFSIDCHLELNIQLGRSHTVFLNLFRIAQEAVNNAIKHANPKNVWIRSIVNEKIIFLNIEDDGTGFEVSKDQEISQGKGIGLKIMKYRANAINMELTVKSTVNKGTVITCEVK